MPQYKFEKTSDQNNTRVYKLSFAPQDVADITAKHMKKKQSNIEIKGFRKGHAPMSVIESRYKNDVYYDVVDEVLDKVCDETIKGENLKLLDRVRTNPVKLDVNGQTEIELVYYLQPTLAKVDLSKANIKLHFASLNDKQIEENISKMVKHFLGEVKEVEEGHKIQNGDLVLVDYHGSIDGKEFEAGHAHDREIEVGSAEISKEFDDALIGHKKGEKVTAAFVMPEGYEEAGKEAEFKISIKSVSTVVTPTEIAEEIYQERFGVKNRDELKDTLKTANKDISRGNYISRIEKDLLQSLYDAFKISISADFIDHKFDQFCNNVPKERVEKYTEDDKKYLKSTLEEKAKREILIQNVVDKEAVQVTNDEIMRKISHLYPELVMKNQEMLGNLLKNENFIRNIAEDISSDKIINNIISKMKSEEVEHTLDEFNKILSDEKHKPELDLSQVGK